MRDWDRKQKQNEVEINELKERVKLKSREMEKLRRDNERLVGLRGRTTQMGRKMEPGRNANSHGNRDTGDRGWIKRT